MDINAVSKAFKIVHEAVENENFLFEYSEYFCESGERSVDYSGYIIPINQYYELHLGFVDYGLNSFEVREIKD